MKKSVSAVMLVLMLSLAVAAKPSHGQSVKSGRLPREVWIASVTMMPHPSVLGKTVDERIAMMLDRMEETAAYNPDIVCLTEVFAHTAFSGLPPLEEIAEEVPGPITRTFAAFAKKHSCYVICPIYTKRGGHFYNASVLIDRKGNVVGEYDKIRPTEGEIKRGITPGPVDPPVFETDFGKIGMQICFDANWPDGFRRLKEKGAEIVFWSSAFAGGRMINSLAMEFKYYIVTCTRYQPARIVDMTGVDLCANGRLQPWLCASVNLDREVFHWDFQADEFRAIQAKYGDKIGFSIEHPEGWFVLESLSPEISLDAIIDEYDLVNYH